MHHLQGRDLDHPTATSGGAWSHVSGGVQFSTPAYGGGGGVGRSGSSSPPLWRSSPPPASPRSLAIARGQRELMEMVQNMPESAYELSLRDMVELPKASSDTSTQEMRLLGSAAGREVPAGRRRKSGGVAETRQGSRGSGGKKNSNRGVNGEFMLKMFFPPSFGVKKSRSGNGRVSPEKNVEGEWWKKRSSGTGDSVRSGSTSSSNSSTRSRSRHVGGFTPGCWPFFHSNKSKSRRDKGGV